MTKGNFTVLMATCFEDDTFFLKQSIESVSINQSLSPNEIILILDGPVSKSTELMLKNLSQPIKELLIIIKNNKRSGLAYSLNKGINIAKNDVIARMDADDVSLPNRFKLQFDFIEKNMFVDVVGGFINEVSLDLKKIYSIRKVPIERIEIEKKIRFSNPISHPSVMFRKKAIIEVGGYPLFNRAQDFALWSLLISKGYCLTNIPEVLVNMRTGDNMFKRRGISYFKSELKVFQFQKKIGLYGNFIFIVNVITRFLLRSAPIWAKKIIYQLREK